MTSGQYTAKLKRARLTMEQTQIKYLNYHTEYYRHGKVTTYRWFIRKLLDLNLKILEKLLIKASARYINLYKKYIKEGTQYGKTYTQSCYTDGCRLY